MYNDQNQPEPGQSSYFEAQLEPPADNTYNPWDILYGILFQPVRTLNKIGQIKPIRLAMLVFLGVQFFNLMINASLSVDKAWPGGVPPAWTSKMNFPEMMHRMTVIGELVGLLIALCFWFLITAVFNLLAEILQGQSNGRGLLAAIGLSVLPEILLPPIKLLTYFGFPNWLFVCLAVAVSLWVAVLNILAIREVNQLSTSRAVAVFSIPLVSLIGLMVLMVIGMTAAIMPFLI